jgi:hypothetical protein
MSVMLDFTSPNVAYTSFESCEIMSSMALPIPVTASRLGPGFTRSETGVGGIVT